LDRDREFRLKLHLSSLPLGWLWIIPAFHLPEGESSSESTTRLHTLRFSHSQLDFAIGPGAAVHQVIVQLEEIPTHDERSTARLMSAEEEERAGFADREGEHVKEDGE
jgi:phosphatidylinositol-3,4,5-trisphosphate 3-phosphatase/dual-specificity protein phosphatase PTEN